MSGGILSIRDTSHIFILKIWEVSLIKIVSLPQDATLFIIKQFCNLPLLATKRAIGVFPGLYLKEPHLQCIIYQQVRCKGAARTEDLINGLGSLNHTHSTGEDTEHTGLLAAR